MKKPRPIASHVLPGMEQDVDAQAAAAGVQQAAELTEQMRRPLGDISGKAGKLERESPLFYGTGENPLLF